MSYNSHYSSYHCTKLYSQYFHRQLFKQQSFSAVYSDIHKFSDDRMLRIKHSESDQSKYVMKIWSWKNQIW